MSTSTKNEEKFTIETRKKAEIEDTYNFDKDFMSKLVDLAEIANKESCDTIEFDIASTDGMTLSVSMHFKVRKDTSDD